MESSFRVESTIRGYHVYKTVWTPFVGKVLPLNPESGNSHNCFAVSVVKDDDVVGHVPREISLFYFMRHNGTISAEVTGHFVLSLESLST